MMNVVASCLQPERFKIGFLLNLLPERLASLGIMETQLRASFRKTNYDSAVIVQGV